MSIENVIITVHCIIDDLMKKLNENLKIRKGEFSLATSQSSVDNQSF
jgi:hypothetical protein